MSAQKYIEEMYGKPIEALSNDQLIKAIQKFDFENEQAKLLADAATYGTAVFFVSNDGKLRRISQEEFNKKESEEPTYYHPTCKNCNGRGSVKYKGEYEACPVCNGNGRLLGTYITKKDTQ